MKIDTGDIAILFAVFFGYMFYQAMKLQVEHRDVCTAELAQYHLPQESIIRACNVTVKLTSK